MPLGKHRASVATTREATSDPDISTLGSTLKRGAMLSGLALGVVQVVSFVQTLILARILDPTQIGLYAAGTVMMGFLLGFTEGGLRGALIQREGDVEDAADTVFWVTFVTGLGLAVLSLASAPIIGLVFRSELAGTIAAVSSGAVVLHALTNVPDGLMQRRFNFKRRLIVDPTRVLGYAIVTITLALCGFGVWSMVIGNYVGIGIWLFLSWRYAKWRPGVGKFHFGLWREMARFAAPLLIEGIVERVRTAAETALIGRRLDANNLGQYRYGSSLAQLPAMVIVQIGSYVLFPAFSRLQSDPPRFTRAFERALQVTWVIAAPLAGLMICLGEPAVVVLLGEKWRAAGVALMVMSGYGVGIALQAVGSEVIKAVGASKMLNWTTATSLVLGIGSLLALLPLGLIGVGIAMSITEIAVGLVILVLSRRIVTYSVPRLVGMLVPPLVAAGVATVATWWVDRNVLNADEHGVLLGFVMLVLDAIVFVVVYLAVLTALAPSLGRSLLTAVRSKLRRGGADDEEDEGDEDESRVPASPTDPDRELVGAGVPAPTAAEQTIRLPPLTASGVFGIARAVISEGLDDATVQMRLISPTSSPGLGAPRPRPRPQPHPRPRLAPLPQVTPVEGTASPAERTVLLHPASPGAGGSGPGPTDGPVDLFSAPDDAARDVTTTSDGRRWDAPLESLRPSGAGGRPAGGPPTDEPAVGGTPVRGAGSHDGSAPVDRAGAQGASGPDAAGRPESRGAAPSGPPAARSSRPGDAANARPDVPGAPPRPRPSPRPRPTPSPPGDESSTAKVPARPPSGGTAAGRPTGGPSAGQAEPAPPKRGADGGPVADARPSDSDRAPAGPTGGGGRSGRGAVPGSAPSRPGQPAESSAPAGRGGGGPAGNGSPTPPAHPDRGNTHGGGPTATDVQRPGPNGPQPAPTRSGPTGSGPTRSAAAGSGPTGSAPTGSGPTGSGPTESALGRSAAQEPDSTGPGTQGVGPKGAGSNGPAPDAPSPNGLGTTGSGSRGPGSQGSGSPGSRSHAPDSSRSGSQRAASNGPAPSVSGSNGSGLQGPGSPGSGSQGAVSNGLASNAPVSNGPRSQGPGSRRASTNRPDPDASRSGVAGSQTPGSRGASSAGAAPTRGAGSSGPQQGAPPSGPAPSGQVPSGATPSGREPSGPAPSGRESSGREPSGPAPSSREPSGREPSRSGPGGSVPGGSVPDGGSALGVPGGRASKSAIPGDPAGHGPARKGSVPTGSGLAANDAGETGSSGPPVGSRGSNGAGPEGAAPAGSRPATGTKGGSAGTGSGSTGSEAAAGQSDDPRRGAPSAGVEQTRRLTPTAAAGSRSEPHRGATSADGAPSRRGDTAADGPPADSAPRRPSPRPRPRPVESDSGASSSDDRRG
ncbi:oligosaccharide flippase family protein [Pseudonocardia dioxanivorans]|uniref:oligosaccharide flippase family protein n=1 Tax=Pseudonocardia dioxanivorans TaxID=240495 RepID=UPI000D03756C|nr:oligosaccharide flippase family protein [Pseudonocardia dioxanivorans]